MRVRLPGWTRCQTVVSGTKQLWLFIKLLQLLEGCKFRDYIVCYIRILVILAEPALLPRFSQQSTATALSLTSWRRLLAFEVRNYGAWWACHHAPPWHLLPIWPRFHSAGWWYRCCRELARSHGWGHKSESRCIQDANLYELVLAACVWLLVVILMLAQKSLHGNWHIFCVQLLLESLDAFNFHYCWPHIKSFSIHNATQRIEQRLEWRQMPSATTCSSVPAASALTCLDLSYLMNRSFEAPKFMLLDHIFGGVYHPIYIQYTFNIHSIHIGTIIIFF